MTKGDAERHLCRFATRNGVSIELGKHAEVWGAHDLAEVGRQAHLVGLPIRSCPPRGIGAAFLCSVDCFGQAASAGMMTRGSWLSGAMASSAI